MTTIKKIKIKHFSINTWFDCKHKSSFCWRYFGDLVCEENFKKKTVCTDQVFCNACLSETQKDNDEISFGLAKIRSYAKTVSTGNLNRHLRDVHNILEEVSTKKLQKNISVVDESSNIARLPIVATTSSSLKMRDSWLLARDMALWYCKSLMPLDSVSDEGMIDFFHKYEIISDREDMPSRYSVTRTALDDIYDSMMINVKAQIVADDAKHVAVALDFWTNRCRRVNYITLTLHYLTYEFVLKSFTLCTKLYDRKAPDEDIQNMLTDTSEYFGLQEKELHYVSDANSNFKRVIALLRLDNHICFGQGLHKLVTVDGIYSIPELEDFIKKCTQIVIAFHRATDLKQNIKKEQAKLLHEIEHVAENVENDVIDPINEEEEEGYSSVLRSTPTRWYNVLAMLESLSQFGDRYSVNNMTTLVNREDLKVNKQEWNVLQDLIRFFQKFREVVNMLSTQNTASLNLALVFHLEIKDILNSSFEKETTIMSTLKHNMLSKMDIRFPITENIVIAALLDPRFISLNLIDTYLQQKNTTHAAFLAEYIRTQTKVKMTPKTIAEPATAIPGPSSKESVLSKLSKKYSSSSILPIKLECDGVDEECWRYLATANATDIDGDDILMYWQEKRIYFPFLSELARAIFAIPVTSSSSERVFSEAGLNLNLKRSRLSPQHLNKMMFIHDNYLHIV